MLTHITDRSFGEDSCMYVSMYLGRIFLNVILPVCICVVPKEARRRESNPLELDGCKHLVRTENPAGAP